MPTLRGSSGALIAALLLLSSLTPPPAVAADTTLRSCSLTDGRFTADLSRGERRQPVVSVVFDGEDASGKHLLTEIIPITDEQTFRISAAPLTSVAPAKLERVNCRIVDGLGDSVDPNGACSTAGHVDIGAQVEVNAIEIVGQKLFVAVTASPVAGGVAPAQSLSGQVLFLRSATKDGTAARTLLFGPGPVSAVIGGDVAAGEHIYELGAGMGDEVSSVNVCL